ncbi:hypothetical protein [Yersinia pekkanenii]|uniref:hypothetical protein n=1 Tax=Yersinia pekkanenii TaxID=1288385 RepID=UPI00066FFBD9|nr:hypothetical protein [Yersinia pekkanenii]
MMAGITGDNRGLFAPLDRTLIKEERKNTFLENLKLFPRMAKGSLKSADTSCDGDEAVGSKPKP